MAEGSAGHEWLVVAAGSSDLRNAMHLREVSSVTVKHGGGSRHTGKTRCLRSDVVKHQKNRRFRSLIVCFGKILCLGHS